jgi:4-amino-4-deoxy-L-arabinose transferase-like glycosyltransferase
LKTKAKLPSHSSKRVWFLPSLLCLIFLAQGLWFIGTQSLTFDEPVHILTGLQIWRAGSYAEWNDHPPLARILLAIPLLGRDWQLGLARRQDQWNDHSPKARLVWSPQNPEALAWHVRPVNLLLGLLLAILLWVTARRLFSEGAANLALVLFVFSPGLIAHFSVATTDGAGTLMVFAAAVQMALWWRNPSWNRTIVLALVLGGLLMAKFYTPPLFALALAVVLTVKERRLVLRPRAWNWSKATSVVAIAFVVLWAGYRFHVPRLTLHDGRLGLTSPDGSRYQFAEVPTQRSFSLPIPAGEYLSGLVDVAKHDRYGHPSYFLGRMSDSGGWKLYFPVAILLKWPTVVLVLFFAAVILALRRRIAVPQEMLVMLCFPAVFLLLSLFSGIEIGDRHILPVYPFVLLLAGALWEFAKQRRALVAVVSVLVLLHVVDGLRYAPDYLSYFNVFVKNDESYRLLSDSNLDWGQGLIALRKYEQDHPGEQVHLVYFGSVYPAQYGVHAIPLPESERASGTVVVSATHLSGHLLKNPDSYRWLSAYPQKAVLNHSLHVFDVAEPPAPHPAK